MTSIFSPRRTKSTKGGVAEPLPETPATLATAHAAAFVKAKRDGDLLVTTHVEEKKGKESEHIVQILRFGMKLTGEQVLARIVAEFQLDKKRAEKEKLVPYLPRGGVYMDLTRPLEQYVMGTTETLELQPWKKPRGTLLVILYEMGKVEQIDVWPKTTVLGVLMAITAKTENTVNECILCTPEPVQELPLELVVPKSAQKLVFLKRSRVTDKAPSVPLFPSRSYLIEQFNAKFQSTMYVPPETSTTTTTTATPPEEPEEPEEKKQEQQQEEEKLAVVDVSAYVAPTTPPTAHPYTHIHVDDEHEHEQEQERDDDADTEHDERRAAPPPHSAAAASPAAAESSAAPLSAPASDSSVHRSTSPRAPVGVGGAVDVRGELLRESDAQTRYARLIALLECEPMPEPRVVAATFKEWFTKDASFKQYFNALGAVRVASLLKNVANALKADA